MKIFIISTILISAVHSSDLVEIFGISRCPDTSRFVHNQLIPFYKDFTGDSELPKEFKLDFHAVPIGGYVVDGHFVNKCLHGATECSLNKLQMCSKKYIKKDWMVTIGCIQGKKSQQSGLDCLPDTDEGARVKQCAETEESEYLLNDENSYRYNVAPGSAWLPWIQINGQRVRDAEYNFKKVVCALESMKNSEKCEN